MPARFDTYDDFMRDLDENSRLSDDPFELTSSVGSLDDDDLELLGFGPARRQAPAAKPAAKKAVTRKTPAPKPAAAKKPATRKTPAPKPK